MGTRRTNRGASGGVAPLVAQFSAVKKVFAGGSIFTTDYYALDGVTGKVAAFIDFLDPTHTVAQGTSANQVPAPLADAGLNGQRSATWSATQFYTSTRAASSWRYTHDGTGCTVFSVFVPTSLASTSALVSTKSGAATGFVFYVSTSPSYSLNVFNTTNTVISPAGGTPVVGTPAILSFTYSETDSPSKYFLRRGNTQLAAGNSSFTPASGDPTSTLILGATPGGGSPGRYRWACTFMVPRVITAAERATVHTYIQNKYGVAA
jgi:hypothetical protein